jgi:hypothetical protein
LVVRSSSIYDYLAHEITPVNNNIKLTINNKKLLIISYIDF